jgi:hypothetical protein
MIKTPDKTNPATITTMSMVAISPKVRRCKGHSISGCLIFPGLSQECRKVTVIRGAGTANKPIGHPHMRQAP